MTGPSEDVSHLCYTSGMTTTIRIDKELRDRVAAAAEREGKSAHAFMLDAIATTVAHAEAQADFHRVADARLAEYEKTGRAIPADEVNRWVLARVRGKAAPKPLARKLRR